MRALDVLFLGTPSHSAPRSVQTLIEVITDFEATRSISFATKMHVAKRRMTEHPVNVIVIFDHFDGRDGWSPNELVSFITTTRQVRPDIFFVYCGSRERGDEIQSIFDRFSHYTKVEVFTDISLGYVEPVQAMKALETAAAWLSKYFQYDVALSYAGEDAAIAAAIATELRAKFVCFSYKDGEHEYAGTNLNEILSSVYDLRSRVFLPILSKAYLEKAWTRKELSAAIANSKRRGNSFLIPVVVEDSAEQSARVRLGDIAYLLASNLDGIKRAVEYRLLSSKARNAPIINYCQSDSEQSVEWERGGAAEGARRSLFTTFIRDQAEQS